MAICARADGNPAGSKDFADAHIGGYDYTINNDGSVTLPHDEYVDRVMRYFKYTFQNRNLEKNKKVWRH